MADKSSERSFMGRRRALPQIEAAGYLSLSEARFIRMVKDGLMPRPRLADGKRLWDVEELDTAFRELPREGDVPGIADSVPGRSQKATRDLSPNPNFRPAVYSVKTLSIKLGCSKGHIYQLIRSGEIKTFKVGELIRIPAEEADRLQEASFEISKAPPIRPISQFRPWTVTRKPSVKKQE